MLQPILNAAKMLDIHSSTGIVSCSRQSISVNSRNITSTVMNSRARHASSSATLVPNLRAATGLGGVMRQQAIVSVLPPSDIFYHISMVKVPRSWWTWTNNGRRCYWGRSRDRIGWILVISIIYFGWTRCQREVECCLFLSSSVYAWKKQFCTRVNFAVCFFCSSALWLNLEPFHIPCL